ncbi:hypothetical protein [Cellvibrio sp. PSBB023]|uniref:hypothetical protein n=1 Tax=Cellvibrio sp. PSBB023 TaxID=1945512 RepID=UPI00122E0D1E|nr:hypothetical protein [Cellvibrio sp. PSBB023]
MQAMLAHPIPDEKANQYKYDFIRPLPCGREKRRNAKKRKEGDQAGSNTIKPSENHRNTCPIYG